MCKPPYKKLWPWSLRAYVLEYAFQWALHLCVSSIDGPFAGSFEKALWAFCRFFWKGFYGPLFNKAVVLCIYLLYTHWLKEKYTIKFYPLIPQL